MPIVMVQQRTTDYPQWREHFDSLDQERRSRGLSTLLVARDAADDGAVVVLLEVDDPERMREHIKSSQLAAAHEGARVVPGSTEITLLEPDQHHLRTE
ncbi:MAG TPA: hypothetical protein VK060_06860 [Ruania sp.]|nr:hypothetical protein [Ruania sp.]